MFYSFTNGTTLVQTRNYFFYLIISTLIFAFQVPAVFASSFDDDGTPAIDSTIPLQLAATKTSKSTRVERIAKEKVAPRPYGQVPVVVSAPSSAIANKPFIVIYRFNGPVTGFSRGLINADKGKLTYYAGNNAQTVYRVLVVPDRDLHKSDDPYTTVRFSSPISGDQSKRVKIIPPVAKGGSGGVKIVELEPHILGHILVSRGGDNVSGSDVQIGNSLSAQVGFTYPLPTSNVLDRIIPRGSIRTHIGYEEFTEGSRSSGNYNKFTTVNGDVLYEVLFSSDFKVIGGLTFALNPKLVSQDLELRDIQDTHDAEVTFENAFGFKLMLEYSPFDLITDNLTTYINAGFSIIDYLPKSIVIKNNEEDVLTSPTRVGGSSAKIAFGIRY